ncbi:ester cyclase [Magnetococcales bacterium HHB-1]
MFFKKKIEHKIIHAYIRALKNQDTKTMRQHCSEDFIVDFVHGDAFHSPPTSIQNSRKFWPALFLAFPQMDYEVTRTIIAPEVITCQWQFTGINEGPLTPPAFAKEQPATKRTVHLRGLSIYDLNNQKIERETMYFDFTTLLVELGITL